MRGMCPSFEHLSRSGRGGEGRVLRDLQNYEQTLTVHRKLRPDDLETLGKMQVPEARIVPASWII